MLSNYKIQSEELKLKENMDQVLLHPSEVVEFKAKELPPASGSVPIKVKAVKNDFYHLGRHKVLECSLSENQMEKFVLLQPEDDLVCQRRQCLLRDFW